MKAWFIRGATIALTGWVLGPAALVIAPAAQAAPAASAKATPAPAASAASPAPAAPPAAAPAVPDGAGGSVRVLVAAEQEATLFSQSIGRINAVNVKLGAPFAAGATLISFDCDEQAARVKMAQAEASAARETHSAKLRLQGLQSAGEVEVLLAAAAAEKSQAEVGLYRAQQSYCTVKAPFNGRAVKLQVKAYEGVNAGAPLIDIISDGPLKLRLNVPSTWLAWLKPRMVFQVRIEETGKTYSANVTAINARVDAVSQSIEIEGTIVGRSPDLLPGMSGLAHFGSAQ
jgi:membrane fusion protein (multidrug efflux system)